jgi:Glycosyl transferase family 21
MLSPLTPVFILLVIWAWVCVGNVIYFAGRWYWFGRRLNLKKISPENSQLKRVAVIEAVKGVEKNFHSHVRSLINQAYPCYRLIFCINNTQDPAFGFLVIFFGLEPQAGTQAYHLGREKIQGLNRISQGLVCVDIVLAGQAMTCSQKICNQIAAYACLDPEDRLIAWVDADACLSDSWLGDLTHPIQNRQLAASTGYRCLVPAGPDWASALTSVINSSILTLLGDHWRNSLWGGSMALTRSAFEKFEIPDYVSRCFSDDESVGALLKKKGIPIYFSFAVLPLGKITYTFTQMFNFGRRQYICARLYYKFHLFIAWLLMSGFSLAFFVLLVRAAGRPQGIDLWLFLGLITAMGLRGLFRFCFIRYLLGRSEYGLKCLFLETAGTPITHLIHLMICCSAMAGSRVEWAGITYKIKGPFHVTII